MNTTKARLLLAFRKRNNLTQKAASIALGYKHATYVGYENGRNIPDQIFTTIFLYEQVKNLKKQLQEKEQ